VRVAVYYSNSDVRPEERPRPAIGPGELLMRIRSSGICGSDLMEWYRKPKAPIVLGHEVAGVVEEVGEGVEAFAVGDRIVTTHHVPCNRCRYCLTDRHSVCPTLHSTTFDPGGFAEFVRLPAVNVDRGTFHLPDDVTFDEGSFVEPLACVIRGQRLTGIKPGDSIAVLGSGVSGILQIQLAKATGAGRIIATDISEPRLQLAMKFGADAALKADAPNIVQKIIDANAGHPIDRVLVCAAAKSALEQALQVVDLGGSVLFFAPLLPEETLDYPAHDLWKRGISIVHSYAGPPADMRAALDLIAAKRIDVANMVTHRLPLEETQKGFDLMQKATDALKVIIEP
jgi:L-iditol 2-dehydrogenase